MRIMHIALGGCLKAPPVAYGITEDTGGHIAYVLGAARAQARLPGVCVEVVTRRIEEPSLGPRYAAPEEALGPGARILRLATARPGYRCKDDLAAEIPSFTEALLAHLADPAARPDVIHAHFADAAEAALAARARHGIPVIYTAHSLALDKRRHAGAGGPGLCARIAREARALAGADAVIASSRDEAERQIPLYEGARAGRVHRIAPGVEALDGAPDIAAAEALLAPFLRAPGRPLVLAIARPVAKKNLAALVDIFAATPGLAERANLAIVAGLREGVDEPPSPEGAEAVAVHRALLAAVDRHDLWGRVALPKRHAPSDVAGLYALAARSRGVFVNPALTEPFGLTLLEAARAGLPVVATCRGGPADILAAIGHGEVADPTDPAAFGRAILRSLADGEAWEAAARAARGAARSGVLGWARYAARHLAICRALTAAPKTVPEAAPPAGPGLLCSDMDGTLTGSRPAAARFRDWAARGERRVAIATGRSIGEARAVLAEWGLPEPCAIASAVGSEIHWRTADGQYEADAAWSARIAEGWAPGALRALIEAIPGVSPQPAIEFRAHKLAYRVDAPPTAEAVRRAIAAAGLPARVILSHGDLLDVLPERAGKAAAMGWIARRLGVPSGAVVAAGDAGNDLDMLEAADLAIVVGGSPELAALRGRPHVHRARAPHADGVLEGIAHADGVLEGIAQARARAARGALGGVGIASRGALGGARIAS